MLRPFFLAAVFLVLVACVRYRPSAVDVPSTAGRIAPVPVETLGFEDAVRRLVRHNAELRRLRAEAHAVNTTPGPDALFFSAKVPDGELGEALIGTELLSLLGIGPRPARAALGRAVMNERVLRHHARARTLVADLAEAYAVDALLASLPSPRPALDVAPFEAAGLATGASLAAAEAAFAQADAEEAVVANLRLEALRRIAQLLGTGPDGEATVVAPPPGWPPVPPSTAQQLLWSRGDLLREQAAFRVADRELRLGVANQWPKLNVFLGANVALEAPLQSVAINLPLDAPAQARTLARAREAARLRFEEAVLDAVHDARARRLDLERAEARARGAGAEREASRALVRAARARIETEPQGAFELAVQAAVNEVRAATRLREASVEVVRARVRAAHAAGWPGAEVVEVLEVCR